MKHKLRVIKNRYAYKNYDSTAHVCLAYLLDQRQRNSYKHGIHNANL